MIAGMPRAPRLCVEDRRRELAQATLPLVIEHGRAVTTRQIAQAAGVAEGTIFRVFATKDEVIEAAIARGFDIETYVIAVEGLNPDGTLDEVLTRATQLMMDRFAHIFRLLTVLGSSAKPTMSGSPDLVERIGKAHERLLAPHRAHFTIAPREVMRYLRLLAFSGSNPHITDGRLLTATEIVTVGLNGTTNEPTC